MSPPRAIAGLAMVVGAWVSSASPAAAADDCTDNGDCAAAPSPSSSQAPAPAPGETGLPTLPAPAGDANAARPQPRAAIAQPLPVAALAAQTSGPALTNEQIATLADIVDDQAARVRERLQQDPSLAPLAVEAIDAHDQRKSSGKALLATGIVIFAATDIATGVIVATAPNYPFIDSNRGWAQVGAGLAVGVVGIAVGLAIGIPGVLKLAKHSDEETRVVESYRPSPDGPSAAPRPPVSLDDAVRVPLIAVTF